MSDLREKQLTAALLLKNAFDVPRVSEAEIANQIFPARAEDTREQDRLVVNAGIAKLRKSNAAPYRTVLTEVEFLRSSDLKRPDSHASFLFACRKNHVFRQKLEPVEPTRDPSTPSAPGSSSPFLRRSASRDPIRDKIKEEICSPSPLLQSNGTPVYRSRSRSNLRSHSTLSGKGAENYPMERNSVEKQSSIINPLYERSNVHQPKGNSFFSTPLNGYSDMRERIPKAESVKPSPLLVRTPTQSFNAGHSKALPFPPCVPYDELCKELRGAMHGVTGKYFVDNGCGKIVVSLTCAISDPHRNLVDNLLALGNSYLELKRLVQNANDESVSSALLYGISQKNDEYATAICNISLKGDPKTLLLIMSYEATPWMSYLNCLYELAQIAKGGNSIEVLNNAFSYLRSSLFTVNEKTIHFCVSYAFRVFCSSLKRWLIKGEVLPQDDWMICPAGDGEGYQFAQYPLFFDRELCDKIYKIGISQHFVTDNEIEKLHGFHSAIEKELNPEMVLHPDRLTEIVNAMSKLVGSVVICRLKTEGKLIEHLNILKQFLLLEDPSFANALYDKLMECSHGLRSTISKSDASAAFVWAISKSPYRPKTNSCVKIDILQSAAGSPNCSSRLQFVQPLNPVYQVRGIAEKIFVKTQESYDLLFHFIWSIQLSVYSIRDVFDKLRIIQNRNKKLSEIISFERICFRLVHKFVRVLFHLRQYTSQMVETQYSCMIARLENVADLESATDVHHKFLSNLIVSFFSDGSQDSISNLIATVLHLSYDLSKLMNEYAVDVEQYSSDLKRHENKVDVSKLDTLREFEEVEKSIDLNTRLLGNRRAKVKVIECSINKTMKELSILLGQSTSNHIKCLSQILNVHSEN